MLILFNNKTIDIQESHKLCCDEYEFKSCGIVSLQYCRHIVFYIFNLFIRRQTTLRDALSRNHIQRYNEIFIVKAGMIFGITSLALKFCSYFDYYTIFKELIQNINLSPYVI